MTWSPALALLWLALLVPVGHVLGRALRRVDDREAARDPVEAPGTTGPPAVQSLSLGSPPAPVPGGSGADGEPDAVSQHA